MRKVGRSFAILASCLLLAAPVARAADVIAHWSFDELSEEGHAFPDLHGPLRALITDKSSAVLDNSKDVPFGKAAMLGPGGNGLSVPSLPGIYDHSFTVAAWVKLSGKANDYVLADWAKPNAYAFGFANGKVICQLRNAKLTSKGQTSELLNTKALNVPISFGTWHHVAWAWNHTGTKSGTLTIYLDGVQAGETTATGKLPVTIANNTRPTSVGYKADTNTAFHGSIDEMWVFNDALTADQVSNLMKSNNIASGEMLANVSPVAAPPAAPTSPASPASPATPDNTSTASTPATPSTPAATDAGSTDSTASTATPAPSSPGDHPITFTTSPPANSGTTASSTPSAPGNTSSSTPVQSASTTTTTTPPAAPTLAAPSFHVTPAPNTNLPSAPTVVAVAPPPHYTPGRIAGIIASGTMSLSLSAFLFWATQERSKMRRPR